MLKRTQAIVTAIVSLIIVAVLISTAFFFANQKTPFGTPPLHIIVDGNFTVSGANPSEIRVYIWDNAAFTNWKNVQISQSPLGRTISFYDSGLTTNGTIEATPIHRRHILSYLQEQQLSPEYNFASDFLVYTKMSDTLRFGIYRSICCWIKF